MPMWVQNAVPRHNCTLGHSGGLPVIATVQPADLGPGPDRAHGQRPSRLSIWHAVSRREVGPGRDVVPDALPHQGHQVSLAEHNYAIEALRTDSAG